MLVDFLAVVVPTVIGSWVVPGPTNELTLVVEFDWLVPPERLTPEGRELAFPELCCPPLALGGANVTKVAPEGRELAFPELCCPPLALGGANVTTGTPEGRELAFPELCCPPATKGFVPLVPRGAGVTVVPLVPRGAGVRVDPITFDPKD